MNELRESPIKCIVVLVGIPGSGKTKFCEKYSTFSEQKQINCLHICYDQLISLGTAPKLNLLLINWFK